MTNKILFTALMLISLSGFAQTNKVLTGTNNQATIYRGGLGSNGAFWLPTHNEDLYTDMPMKGRVRFTDKLQVHDGTNWVDVGGGDKTLQEIVDYSAATMEEFTINMPRPFGMAGYGGKSYFFLDSAGAALVTQSSVVGVYEGYCMLGSSFTDANNSGQGFNRLYARALNSTGYKNEWSLPVVNGTVNGTLVRAVNGITPGTDGNVVFTPPSTNFSVITGDPGSNASLAQYITNAISGGSKFGVGDNLFTSGREVNMNDQGLNLTNGYLMVSGADKLYFGYSPTSVYVPDGATLGVPELEGYAVIHNPDGTLLFDINLGMSPGENISAKFYDDNGEHTYQFELNTINGHNYYVYYDTITGEGQVNYYNGYVFNYREKAGVVLELDEGTNNKMIYSSSDGQLSMGDIPRFGIEDKTTEVDRNVDMDNNDMLFDNTKKFQINGSDTLNYVSYTGENMGWSYENSTGNAEWDDFSTFYYGNYVGIPQEFVNVHILIDGEETEFEYFLVDAEFGVYIGEKATDGNTYALAGADIIKKISPTVVLNVAEKEYEGESVLIVDESGAVKQTNYPAPSLDAAAAVSNTIYNKGIRLQNSGELSINLGVYPRQNEISIFDPNEPTLNRIAIERHNIAYTYQPGNVAFKIGFPTSGDGIYKTATFQNKTGDVALLSDVYGRYAERIDITASMSVTALNAAYPNAMGGFEVGCPNMTPPTIYKKMSNTTGWYVIQTTKI